jgi:hypothetical protein
VQHFYFPAVNKGRIFIMKFLRLVLSLGILFACVLSAQEERQAPPTEIPDFSNLDEFIYVPKSTMQFGARNMSGPKTSFSGKGKLATDVQSGTDILGLMPRTYHDGSVSIDARTTVVDNGDGTTSTLSAPNDGKTNTWNFISDKQLTADGYMLFRTYSADITDTRIRSRDAGRTSGVELGVAYDMGKLMNRFDWSIIAAAGVNDIASSLEDAVAARLTTVTDTYNLFGRLPPAAPYSAPSSVTTSVVNADGTTSSDTADTTTLLSNRPIDRKMVFADDSSSVRNRWKLKGAYYTVRVGPSVSFQITTRLKVMASAGLAGVYAGSTYSVNEAFQPETGAEISVDLEDETTKFLVGYYADANLQFDATERTGFYVGAVYQATGSYDQEIATANANYVSNVDLNGLNGFRAGLTYKF